jgi:8-amino-7-oxononanoate synthase
MPELNNISKKLSNKLNLRIKSDSLRSLNQSNPGIDFYSNDYLGLAQNKEIYKRSHQYLLEHNYFENGSTGSRLISGNHPLFIKVENQLAKYHQTPSALIFNSGYDANLGLLSSIPQRGDIVIYDQLCHASIRDGLRLSNAKAIGFEHNDMHSLENKLIKHSKNKNSDVYIVTESIFSMDGDAPDFQQLLKLSEIYQARVIIDEAHALGVYEYGLVQKLGLQDSIFARVITFGKALGCHGAVVLGSTELTEYLVNFARSFVYTTALPPIALAHIKIAYEQLNDHSIQPLLDNISYFKKSIKDLNIKHLFIESDSAIQSCVISGNEGVKSIASILQKNDFNVKAILSPTVPVGQERLRFCIHSFNSKNEISCVLELLKKHL